MDFRHLSVSLFMGLLVLTAGCSGDGEGNGPFDRAMQGKAVCESGASTDALQAMCSGRSLARSSSPLSGAAPREPDATALFDWAELAYPQLFPSAQANLAGGEFTYRYYQETGNYIGVKGTGVWVMGPLVGDPMLRVYMGELASFSCSVFPSSCAPSAPSAPAADRCLNLTNNTYLNGLGSLSSDPIIPATGAFTVELWVLDPGIGGWMTFLSQGVAGSAPLYFGIEAGTRRIRAGSVWTPVATLPSKRWVHLALTRSPTGNLALYVDGTLADSKQTTSSYFNGNLGRFFVGSKYGANDSFLGCLDDLKIWKTQRSADQVRADMAKGAPDSADLVAYYSFDEAVEPARMWQAASRPGSVLQADHLIDLVPVADAPGLTSLEWSNRAFSSSQDNGYGLYMRGDSEAQAHVRGASFYSAVWPISHAYVPDLGLGMGSTWLGVDLQDLWTSPLINNICLSMEGGAGYWGDQKFRSAMPKWRFGITPDCYKSMWASPGWSPGGKVTPQGNTGLIQLSNRIVEPPDGFTFRPDTFGELIGVAWMALPWPSVAQTVPPTGPNAWTLFMNTANFKGPVAYILPQAFSAGVIDRAVNGLYSLDGRDMRFGGVATEWATLPMVSTTSNGATYSRVPQLDMPVDAAGRTVISRDLKAWSSDAIETPFARWLAGEAMSLGPFVSSAATNVTMTVPQMPFWQSGQRINIESRVKPATFEGGTVFGLQWFGEKPGSFPSYFRSNGVTRDIVSAAEAPSVLSAYSFTRSKAGIVTSYSAPDPDWWAIGATQLPTGWAKLADGSIVTYRWYRFVDQPALKRLNLTAAEKDTLQSLVTRLHKVSTTEWLPPPTGGKLASLDEALLVKPPPGYEYGYVPIAISQYGRALAPALPARP